MITLKRVTLVGLLVFISVSMVLGQSASTTRTTSAAQPAPSSEISVEESYLQDVVERMIIQEQIRAESRDMKFVALRYIEDAINRGNTGPDIQSALEYLSMEGVMNQARENGRLVNNFPDVRTVAVAYLGELGTPEARDTLMKVVIADGEPMVLTEAIKSLAKIGIDDNGETSEAISWIVRRFDVLNPDNLLALSALDAFEILAQKNGGRIRDPNTIQTIMRIVNGPYIRPVKDRARGLIDQMRRAGSGS